MYVCEFQGCKAKYHRHREYVSHLSINHPSNRSGYMCGFKSRDSQQCSMRLSSLRDLKQHVICIHKASRSLQPSSLQVSEVVIRCKQAKCMGYMASTQSTFYKHLREIHGGNEEKVSRPCVWSRGLILRAQLYPGQNLRAVRRHQPRSRRQSRRSNRRSFRLRERLQLHLCYEPPFPRILATSSSGSWRLPARSRTWLPSRRTACT